MNNSANPNEPEKDSMVTLETVKKFFLWNLGKNDQYLPGQNDLMAMIAYSEFIAYCRDNNLIIPLAEKE